jgi:IS1 family transposase
VVARSSLVITLRLLFPGEEAIVPSRPLQAQGWPLVGSVLIWILGLALCVFAVGCWGFELGAKPLEGLGTILDPSVILHKVRLAILPHRFIPNPSIYQQKQCVGRHRIEPVVNVVEGIHSVLPVFKVPAMKLIGFTGGKDSSFQVYSCISKLRNVGKRIIPVPDQKSGVCRDQPSYALTCIYGTPIEPRWSGGRIKIFHISLDGYPSPLTRDNGITLLLDGSKRSPRVLESKYSKQNQPDGREIFRRKQSREIAWRLTCGPVALWLGCLLVYHVDFKRSRGWRRIGLCLLDVLGTILIAVGLGAFFLPVYWEDEEEQHKHKPLFHSGEIVTQKHLTSYKCCNTVISMANVLNTDKQIGVISALAEGSSIRSIERMTGVHRDTIMRLGVKVGQGCTALMDTKMRDLSCTRLELDEIWGFVGKKDKNVRLNEPHPVGNVWTFCAIDADTKLVPAFKVGDRDIATAKAFVSNIASRMRNRVQISTDGLRAYVEAIESAFGAEVDFAQIVKTYGHEEVSDNRRYSAPEFVSSEKKVITGHPDERLISTSYVERLNATTRLHMRRLTRLTLAFSKKRENFEAAVGLHFAYYNFVKRHNTLRCTPAMAAGVERDFWSVGDLVEAAS